MSVYWHVWPWYLFIDTWCWRLLIATLSWCLNIDTYSAYYCVLTHVHLISVYWHMGGGCLNIAIRSLLLKHVQRIFVNWHIFRLFLYMDISAANVFICLLIYVQLIYVYWLICTDISLLTHTQQIYVYLNMGLISVYWHMCRWYLSFFTLSELISVYWHMCSQHLFIENFETISLHWKMCSWCTLIDIYAAYICLLTYVQLISVYGHMCSWFPFIIRCGADLSSMKNLRLIYVHWHMHRLYLWSWNLFFVTCSSDIRLLTYVEPIPLHW